MENKDTIEATETKDAEGYKGLKDYNIFIRCFLYTLIKITKCCNKMTDMNLSAAEYLKTRFVEKIDKVDSKDSKINTDELCEKIDKFTEVLKNRHMDEDMTKKYGPNWKDFVKSKLCDF